MPSYFGSIMIPLTTPILGFAAFSGTGKTTLLTQLVPLLRQRGLRIGLLKHSHHSFAIDTPGKDSYVLHEAGAMQTVVASSRRTMLMVRHAAEPALENLLQRIATSTLDIILVEGFKYHAIPKIELYRPSLGYPLLCRADPNVIAVATNAPLPVAIDVPLLDLNAPAVIADFIHDRYLTTGS